MKQKLLKSFLLLCGLIVGSTSWADDVTLAYETASTTNMTGNNDAATVGLDASEWSVVGYKGSNSNYPGLNKAGQVRLYYHKDGSNFITVSSLVGATINSITVTYGESNNNAIVKVGSSVIEDTNDAAGTGQYAIKSSSFTIENGYSSNTQVWITSIVINYTPSGTPKVAKPVISGDEIFINSTEVSITCGTEGATIQYSLDDGANWTNYSAPFTITETKTVKAKASKKDMEDSEVATKLFNMKMPLTVTRAIGAINMLDDNGTMPYEFVQGKISQIDNYNSSYKSITYWISDDGTTTNQLEVYSGKGLNGADFAAATDLNVGDEVIVFGTLKKYVKDDVTTPEFTANSKIVKYTPSETPVPALTVSKTSLTGFTYVENNGPSAEQSFEVTGTNLTGDVTLDLGEPSYYEISVSEGTGFATKLVLNKVEANPKTIFVRLKAGLDKNESYSGTITITSEGAEAKTVTLGGSVTEYVPDYAELPFEWDSKTAPTGITNSGVGTYNSSPYLKFDTTGDYIILKINEAPGTLAFDIKGNTFSGGTFKVQTSADGETYKDLETYTELASTQTESFTLTSDVRYIKWIYTTKDKGNVALGNIKVVDWAETATIGEAGYATYVTKHNVSFPAGVEASIATEVNTKLGYIATTEVTAVPKGTPILLKGKADTYTLIPAAESELSDVTGNLLKISDGKVQGSSTIYILAKPADGKVAFYPTKEGTRIKEGKAYLEIPGSAGIKAFYFDGDAETAINEVNGQSSMINGQSIYNLAGQRISKMQKGINIVNGKKILK